MKFDYFLYLLKLVIKIIDLQMSDLYQNLDKIGYSVSITKKAKSNLAIQGFSSEYGARNLRREIQKSIEDPLSELLLKNTSIPPRVIILECILEELKLFIINVH